MVVKVKSSKDNEWGFVEEFRPYRYLDSGYIEVTLAISGDTKFFTEPYIFRGGNFIPLSVIDEEIGIPKYIKAKKPFYSKLSGGFVVTIKAGINYDTGIFLRDRSSFKVYSTSLVNCKDCTISLKPILDVPEQVADLMDKLMVLLVSTGGDREKFLRLRLNE